MHAVEVKEHLQRLRAPFEHRDYHLSMLEKIPLVSPLNLKSHFLCISSRLDPVKNNEYISDSHCSEICFESPNLPPNQDLGKASSTRLSKVSFNEKTVYNPNIFEGEDIVPKYLESIVLQNERLLLIRNHNTLLREDYEYFEKVKILSGGATGLEPLFSGSIGPGMLTAAIFGSLTSSPAYMSILATLRLLSRHHSQGILVIAMNNMADRLNFVLACQQAAREGINTMCLTIGEDCSGICVDSSIGRRGLCGILFLLKLAGAMSEEGRSLTEMYCTLTALKSGTIGTVNVGMEKNFISFGQGLRGETGIVSGPKNEISSIIKEALYYILNPNNQFSLYIEKGDNLAVIINNLGGLSQIHFNLIVNKVISEFKAVDLNVIRIYSGRFLSSKCSVGFSISVLKVNLSMLKWLDFPVHVTIWPTRVTTTDIFVSFKKRCTADNGETFLHRETSEEALSIETRNLGPRFTLEQATLVVDVLKSIVQLGTNIEEQLNQFDLDHDYGSSMRKFIVGINSEMESKTLSIVTPFGLLNNLAELAVTSMGGISGSIFNVMLRSAAQAFLPSSSHSPVCWEMWIAGAHYARDALTAYTRVQLGQRTVFDALHPFVEAFKTPTLECLGNAVKAAVDGAEATGTSGGQQHPSKDPDPGAVSLAIMLTVIFSELKHRDNDDTDAANTSSQTTES